MITGKTKIKGEKIIKIRTDFVTNSSSSSFILTLKFELTNGEVISWEGVSDCGEGSYDYGQLSTRKSPKELGSCDSIESLIEMVKGSVGEGILDYGEGFAPIFSDDSPIIESLKKLTSMDDIAKITIEGYEDTFRDYDDGPEAFDDTVTYDMKTKTQTAIGIGSSCIESEGRGGALDFEHFPAMQDTPDGYFDAKREHPLF